MEEKEEKFREYQRENKLGPVEAAVILVRHYKLFLCSFLSLVILGAGVLLFDEDEYDIVTILEIGQSGEDSLLTSPSALISVSEAYIWPKVLEEYQGSHKKISSVSVDLSNDRGTNLVKAVTVASEGSYSLVRDLHERLVNKVLARHEKLRNDLEKRMNDRLSVIGEEIQSLRSEEQNSQALGALYQSRADLKGSLDSLSDTKSLTIARMESRSVGKPTSIIFIVLVFMSLIFSLFLAFFAEFSRVVMDRIRQTNS